MISAIFPTRLKYATIKPIFKNGDKTNVADYRPISILPPFSKILEKIMYRVGEKSPYTQTICTSDSI
jgi:hypothetical protein